MCGLFGCIGDDLDPVLIRSGILKANSRGPHGCGISVWYPGNDRPKTAKFIGDPDKNLMRVMKLAYGAKIILYHARLATSGLYYLEENLQPFSSGRFYAVHNGNIPDYENVKKKFGLENDILVDSKLIPILLLRLSNDGSNDGLKTIAETICNMILGDHFALIVTDGHFMAGHCRGLPLEQVEKNGCKYFCSRKII